MNSTWIDDISDRVLDVPQRLAGRGGCLAAGDQRECTGGSTNNPEHLKSRPDGLGKTQCGERPKCQTVRDPRTSEIVRQRAQITLGDAQ